jgi:hypothetical protein
MWRNLFWIYLFLCLHVTYGQVGHGNNPLPNRAGNLIEAGQVFLQKRDYVKALQQFEAAKPILE